MNKQPMDVAEIVSLATSVITLPPFEEGGQEICVRVKKPDLGDLIRRGEITNELLGLSIQKLSPEAMVEAIMNPDDKEAGPAKAFAIIDVLIKATLVSPKWDTPIAELGCTFIELLTLEQKMEIAAYAGGGIKAMSSFREQPGEHAEVSGDSEGVGGKAERLPAGADDVGSVLPGRSVRLRDEREAAGAGGTKPSGSRTTAAKKVGRPKKTQKTS